MAESLNQRLLARFLKYVSFDTQSDPNSPSAPSTSKQLMLAEYLVKELHGLGVENAHVGIGGIVYAHIPATQGCEDSLPIGFLSHMDTSPDASDLNPKPRIIKYLGGDVVLNKEKNIIFRSNIFTDIKRYVGQEIIFTDGTTLLGCDDKAGIAEIMGMVDYLREHPEVPHAKICIAFTPDEEIARGTVSFDLDLFGAKYAYTFDGDEIGNLEGENFNAAGALLTIEGIGVHPGKAKGKMINTVRLATEFIERLPKDQSPETTEGREGYFHPDEIHGDVVKTTINMLIRDHDEELFEGRKNFLRNLVSELAAKYPKAKFTLDISARYNNMKKYLDKTPMVMEIARRAYKLSGVEIQEVPIRGGTDGAQLSELGLPCPNIFSGGFNYHGIYECLPINSMQKARDVAVNLVKLSSEIKALN